MRKKTVRVCLSFLIVLASFALVLGPAHGTEITKSTGKKGQKKVVEADILRADCPVTGEPVLEQFSTQLGKARVYFATAEAKSLYLKQPAEFLVTAHAQIVATGQAEQIACPQSGGDLSPFVRLPIEGVDVQFADKSAQAEFSAKAKDEQAEAVFGEAGFEKLFRLVYEDSKTAKDRKTAGSNDDEQTLRRKLAQGPRTEEEVAESMRRLAPAMQAQDRNFNKLMFQPGVTGTAATFDSNGRPVIQLLLEDENSGKRVPYEVDGIPVVREVIGKVYATEDHGRALNATHLGDLQAGTNPAAEFPRPVPIGVSTGVTYSNGPCASGTIGCRLKGKNLDGSVAYFMLSNNHVLANANLAPLESMILQPGLADSSCLASTQKMVARLTRYQQIQFNNVSNKIDAAIAKVDPTNLGKGTPIDGGYGTPKSAVLSPAINMQVMKYGRTTAKTTGYISAVNTSIKVTYPNGSAMFSGQITVVPNGTTLQFSKAGDSGSLVVTNPGRNPVGLLFAGNLSGTYSICNKIGDVLNAFKSSAVTVDGE